MRGPPQPNSFRVAIIGGGIGGLITAISLAHHCPEINIDVYEQAPAYAEIGAGVGIAVNAAKVLHRLGVGKAANAISGERNHIHRTHRRWDNGKEIVTVRADFDEGDIRQLSVHRAEFLDILLDAIKERGIATLHTNKKCIGLRETGDQVTVKFEDGSEATADMVVGADGIHSVIRGQFKPDFPTYSGRICYRGLLPLKDVEAFWPFNSYAVSWLGPSKHFLVFPISQNRTLNVVAFVSKSQQELDGLKESWSSYAPRSDLENEYKSWDETVVKTISCMGAMPAKWKLNDRELLSQWTYMGGKVVLLGDAAHAMLPHQGSGAGHAIEDSYILGRCLQDFFKSVNNPLDESQQLATWTKLYQDVRLPRAHKAQITSRQAGNVYEMQGPEFEGLKYDDCLPIVAEKLKNRMRWVWGADIDEEYEEKTRLLRSPN